MSEVTLLRTFWGFYIVEMSVVGLASDILELSNRENVRSYTSSDFLGLLYRRNVRSGASTDILELINRESVRSGASFGHFEACKSSKCP